MVLLLPSGPSKRFSLLPWSQTKRQDRIRPDQTKPDKDCASSCHLDQSRSRKACQERNSIRFVFIRKRIRICRIIQARPRTTSKSSLKRSEHTSGKSCYERLRNVSTGSGSPSHSPLRVCVAQYAPPIRNGRSEFRIFLALAPGCGRYLPRKRLVCPGRRPSSGVWSLGN